MVVWCWCWFRDGYETRFVVGIGGGGGLVVIVVLMEWVVVFLDGDAGSNLGGVDGNSGCDGINSSGDDIDSTGGGLVVVMVLMMEAVSLKKILVQINLKQRGKKLLRKTVGGGGLVNGNTVRLQPALSTSPRVNSIGSHPNQSPTENSLFMFHGLLQGLMCGEAMLLGGVCVVGLCCRGCVVEGVL